MRIVAIERGLGQTIVAILDAAIADGKLNGRDFKNIQTRRDQLHQALASEPASPCPVHAERPCVCDVYLAEQRDEKGGYYWWCPQCSDEVPGEAVTYEEFHDTRSGGCGHQVVARPVNEKTEQPGDVGLPESGQLSPSNNDLCDPLAGYRCGTTGMSELGKRLLGDVATAAIANYRASISPDHPLHPDYPEPPTEQPGDVGPSFDYIAGMLDSYAECIHEYAPANDFARWHYVPEIQEMAAQLRALRPQGEQQAVYQRKERGYLGWEETTHEEFGSDSETYEYRRLYLVETSACTRCHGSGVVSIGDGYSVDRCPCCNGDVHD